MEYDDILTHIGLTKNEATVYLALVQFGEGSAQSLAEKTGLKRPTIYLILEELRKKGAILKVPESKKARYSAKPPHELYDQHLERVNRVASIIPRLEAMYKNDERANTWYFDSAKGVKEALQFRQDELKGTELRGFWGKVDTWDRQTKEVIEKWNKTLVRDDITVRAVAPAHESLKPYRKTDEQYGREVKTIPYEKYSTNASIEATDLFVRITQYDVPQSVIIESPEMAKTVSQIFEMVWESLPEDKGT